MSAHDPSRRTFLMASVGIAAAAAGRPAVGAAELTAGQVIERIKANVGVPWRAETVDKIVAGAAETPVRGIATTMMATLESVRRAVGGGANLIITHEPTFYSHLDTTEELRADPTYQVKRDYLDKNQVVVFRFHDHWHARRPDGIAVGMARELGWEGSADSAEARSFTFAGTTLGRLVEDMRARLRGRTIRVVGDPALPVRRVATSWGYASQMPGIATLARADVDVLVVGEAREWEVVEYAQDAIASGRKKALVLLGHISSEQAGMKYCAEWLRGFVKEAPVAFVEAAEPFWAPA